MSLCSYVSRVLTVVQELHHELIDNLNPSGTFRKADTVASRREPFSNSLESTMVVMTRHVVQNGGIIDESIQFSASDNRHSVRVSQMDCCADSCACVTISWRAVYSCFCFCWSAYNTPGDLLSLIHSFIHSFIHIRLMSHDRTHSIQWMC